MSEALRYAHYVKPGGELLLSDYTIQPIRFPGAPETSYPEKIPEFLRGKKLSVLVIPAMRVAVELGDKRCANVVLLGALASRLDLRESSWRAALERRFPARILDLNLRAFEAGRELAGRGSRTANV